MTKKKLLLKDFITLLDFYVKTQFIKNIGDKQYFKNWFELAVRTCWSGSIIIDVMSISKLE